MIKNSLKYLYILIILPFSIVVHAQDVLPLKVEPVNQFPVLDTLYRYIQVLDTVPVPHVMLPSNFKHVEESEIEDSLQVLSSFWEKLQALHRGTRSKDVTIVQIGDSHVRGQILPQSLGKALRHTFTAINFIEYGVNGAFCRTYTHDSKIDRIVSYHPDLLILSFGTNESYDRHYLQRNHLHEMDALVRLIREKLPNTPLLMTTPTGCYVKKNIRRRSSSYVLNPRNAITATTIQQFAADNGIALWNLYQIGGGVRSSCSNWLDADLMRPDHIHFKPHGYILQAQLFYQAFIKAYNTYVQH